MRDYLEREPTGLPVTEVRVCVSTWCQRQSSERVSRLVASDCVESVRESEYVSRLGASDSAVSGRECVCVCRLGTSDCRDRV